MTQSAYEKNRIIKEDFGKTEMGRDLLAQDYMLKQITASLIYPQEKLGQEFWNKVYAKAYQQFGTTNIPVNTFNKVWIVPDDAEIMEKGNMAYVLKNHLKVMLEEDYLSLSRHSEGAQNATEESKDTLRSFASAQDDRAHSIASNIVRQIILPEIEKEVNEGKNFAPLRQVFSGVVLAAWYKRELKQSFLGQVYMNKSHLKGVDQDPKNNQIIYQRYLKAFKKGVFNFIKEDVDKYSNETVPRKYFSGGTEAKYDNASLSIVPVTSARLAAVAADISNEDFAQVAANEVVKTSNAAMRTIKKEELDRVVSRLAQNILNKPLQSRVYPNFIGSAEKPVFNLPELNRKKVVTYSDVKDYLLQDEQQLNQIAKQVSRPDKQVNTEEVLSQIVERMKYLLLEAYNKFVEKQAHLQEMGDEHKPQEEIIKESDKPVFIDENRYMVDYMRAIAGLMKGYPDIILYYRDAQNSEIYRTIRLNIYSIALVQAGVFQKGDPVDAYYNEKGVKWYQNYPTSPLLFWERHIASKPPVFETSDEAMINPVKWVRAFAVANRMFWYDDGINKFWDEIKKRNLKNLNIEGFEDVIPIAYMFKEMGQHVRDIFLDIWADPKITTYDQVEQEMKKKGFKKNFAYDFYKTISIYLFDEKDTLHLEVLKNKDARNAAIKYADFLSDYLKRVDAVIDKKPGSLQEAQANLEQVGTGCMVDSAYALTLAVKTMKRIMENHPGDDPQYLGYLFDRQYFWYKKNILGGAWGELTALHRKVYNRILLSKEELIALLKKDKAMKSGALNTKTDNNVEGGIDVNTAYLNLHIKRDGNGVPLPILQQDMAQLNSLEGLEPVILQIRPARESALLNKLLHA